MGRPRINPPAKLTTFKWTTGSKKTKKTAAAVAHFTGQKRRTVVGFSLPAFRSQDGFAVCPYAGACVETCYARYGQMWRYNPRQAYEHNLTQVRLGLEDGTLAQKLLNDLSSFPVAYVRLHHGGDFFSPAYYRAWLDVIRQMPHVTFWAYTKSLPLLDWDAHPPNFRVVQSLMGKLDHRIDFRHPHSRWFLNKEDLFASGYSDGNGEFGDWPVIRGDVRIGLIHHGIKKPTPNTLVAIRKQPTSSGVSVTEVNDAPQNGVPGFL